MDVINIVAYTTFITAGFTGAYMLLLAAEVKSGRRKAEKFRSYLDRKVTAMMGKVERNAKVVSRMYKKGSDEVEKDLIDPVTKPILETQHRYVTLKTGERSVRRAGMSKTSPHLQKLLKQNKKVGRNQSARFRRRLKKLQKEAQKENNKK